MTTTMQAPAQVEQEKARKPWGFAVLVVVILVAVVAGGWLQVETAKVRGSVAATNRAVRDPAAGQVATQLSASVARIFSYTATDPTATSRFADQALTGTAAAQYKLLFGQVSAHAGEQKLTVATTVVSTAVSSLTDNHVVVLFFCDQRAARAGQPATVAAADLLVTADRTNGRWLISAIQAV
ncbi:hypothetical protein GCM10009765_36370 [Fodinicola feengrottensis]|uniref:Mce-associated membrane protein n=1 Tax=Fodinicola feengrottensis TaxID=435914 RepID=A0ABP4T854_9ACTN